MIVCTILGPEDLNTQITFPTPPAVGDEVELISKIYKVVRRRWVFSEECDLLITVE